MTREKTDRHGRCTTATPIETEADAEKAVGKRPKEAVGKAKEAATALAAGDISVAADKSMELFTTYGIPAITALIVIILSYFVAAFLARIASKPVRAKVDETLGRFIGKLVFYLVMTAALLGVLQYFGIGISGFAAVLAAAGFAVGLAFQGTLSNFAAGIMLLVFRPFKVGDAINAAGITAKVYEIDLFHTVFDTPDNRRIIVPNSAISGGTIENISHHQERRVDVNVGIDYGASLDRTREILTTAAESLSRQTGRRRRSWVPDRLDRFGRFRRQLDRAVLDFLRRFLGCQGTIDLRREDQTGRSRHRHPLPANGCARHQAGLAGGRVGQAFQPAKSTLWRHRQTKGRSGRQECLPHVLATRI